MRKSMSKAERFFWQHAGFSYDPAKETRAQGRRRCAEELAQAESFAYDNQWYVLWEPEDDPDLSMEDPNKPHEVYRAVLVEPDKHSTLSNVLESLGNIVDPDDNYQRVIEAELALDAIARKAKAPQG